MKILLDAGHGPETPGKRSPDGMLREFSFNLAVAESVARTLTFEGVSVTVSHRRDRDVPLANRIALANQTHVDAFVSIHANAYGTAWNGANGIETFVYPTASKQSFALAKHIQQSMIIACNRADRGVKTANFAILRETRMPAVLIECGFMTNREEATLLMQKAYREQCAKAIAFAILSWKYRSKS